MFTLLDGDPNHASTRLDVFEVDGRSRRGACDMVIRDHVLYLIIELTPLQQDGQSVFEYCVSSYVKDGGPSAGMTYQRVVSQATSEMVATTRLANADMVVVNGAVPGWRLSGKGAEKAVLTADAVDRALVIDELYAGGALLQAMSLSPGHYLLRALVKADTFAAHLGALGYRIPIGVRDDYQWVELPFCVPCSERDAPRHVDMGIWHIGYPPTRHYGTIRLKKMELARLGDTALPQRWAETLPVDPLHRLKLLAESPSWDRPGKVVFQDAFLGTELWLMTQEGKVDHSYVGHPDFSHEGKYLHIGLRRVPRGLLRTDGSARYLDNTWRDLVWMFPWERNRLPVGTDPVDWIVTSRSPAGSPGLFTPPMGSAREPEAVPHPPAGSMLYNVASGATHHVALPSRPGWRIVHYSGIASYGGRGPSMRQITHDAVAWLSEDGRSLGRSTIEGDGFQTFPVKSISSRPEDDKLDPSMSSVWGKAGDLEHATIWTLALANFHDYAIRYKTRWNKDAYHKPMFRPAPTFSPDFTKVIFFSAMLTGDHPDRKWGDVYVAVARYPEPPLNVRLDGMSLAWDVPRRHTEIVGYRLYRSAESGRGYERVGGELLTGTRHELPPDAKGCYVLTSVEYSGLEGRAFSNELAVGAGTVFRHFYRPAVGKIVRPMVPFFEPAGTADGQAVAVTDPELVYKRQLEEGLRDEGPSPLLREEGATGSVAMQIAIPEAAKVRILARVRGMSALERASYTTGWPEPGEAAAGRFVVRLGGQAVGAIPVEGHAWRWVALDAGAVSQPAGTIELQLATHDAGIAVDHILVTNDAGFTPTGCGQAPEELTAVPQGLRIEPLGPSDEPAIAELLKAKKSVLKLAWEPTAAPQGVARYNVYRADRESFEAEPETLLGSPSEPVFYDVGLETGKTVYYRVRAVDAWDNQSPASAVVAITAAAQAE